MQTVLGPPGVTIGKAVIVIDELTGDVPPGPVTVIVPVVAPDGIVTEIEVEELTVKVGAFVPFTETEVTPEKAVPVIVIELPRQTLAGIDVIVGRNAIVIVRLPPLELHEEFCFGMTYIVVDVETVKVNGETPEATTGPVFPLPVLMVKKSPDVPELIL